MIPEFSATGGVSYARTDAHEHRVGEGLEAEFTTQKRVDHVGLVNLSRSIINRAYHVMDKLAVSTPIGYFADPSGERKITEALAPIVSAAEEFNEMARSVGSGRRVHIAIYPVRIREDDETAARRIATSVREKLEDLQAALAQGDREAFERAWDKARNLDRLATGIQADSIRLALEAAKEQKGVLLESLRAGDGREIAASKLDLSALDAAISLFQEAVDLGVTETGAGA